MGLRFVVREGTKLAGLTVVGFLLLMVLVAFTAGCDSDTGTSPDVVVSTPTPAPPTAATPAPPPAPTPAPKTGNWWFEGGVGDNASWDVLNKSGEALTWTAYLTSFDDQVTAIAALTTTTRNGDNFRGSFNRTCVQIDLQQGVLKVGEKATAAPFVSGFINGYGKVVRAAQARDGCAPPPPPDPKCEEYEEPEATPGQYTWNTEILPNKCEVEVGPIYESTVTPSLNCHQTGSQPITYDLKCSEDRTETRNLCRNVACATPPPPPPCVPTWTELPPVITTSDWSTCTLGEQTQTTRTVISEVNSCDQTTRVKSDTTVTNKRECPLTCTERVAAMVDGGPRCVELTGGQSSECTQVAAAFGQPGLALDGQEDRLTQEWKWTKASAFAFVVDANECPEQPKAVRVQKATVIGGAVPFANSDVDGNSATYCTCK